MKSKVLSGILTVFLLVFFMNSCNKGDDHGAQSPDDNGGETLPSIVALAESVNVLSTLVDALGQADTDLATDLAEGGIYTVFAPTNDAFNALLAQLEGFDSLNDFDTTEEKALLEEILKYHVVDDVVAFSDALSNEKILKTLQSEELKVSVDSSVFISDKTDMDAEVLSADNEASNGVVHIIDKILLPDSVLAQLFPKSPIATLISETENLSLLNQALIKADLVEDLNGEGPFTIFAPSNDAIQGLFDQLGQGFASFDDFNNPIEIQVLKSLLLYHVVSGELVSDGLQVGPLATLLENESIEVIASGDSFEIGDATDENAKFEGMDNEASNGIIHIIDKVLIPQFVLDFLGDDTPTNAQEFTIAELVQSSEDFSLLKEALELTGLLETLNGEGPITVFAPGDEALQSLFPLLGANYNSLEDFDSGFEKSLLRTLLSYHVLPRSLPSDDFSDTALTTLAHGDQLRLVPRNNGFAVVDAVRIPADVLVTDIKAKNGVVHTVERILLAPSTVELVADETMVALMDFFERHDVDIDNVLTLLRMLNSQLGEVFESEFTFFLPTNQAFLNLFDSLEGIDSLADFDTEEKLRLLATILAYHCVELVKVEANTLENDLTVETLQGESLKLIRSGNTIEVLDKTREVAHVVSADNVLLNGVIHFIDKVLLPNEAKNPL